MEARVQQQVDEINRMGQLSRYVSPQIAEFIRKGNESIFASHRREVTVVFLGVNRTGGFEDILSGAWERVYNSAKHHAQPRDFAKVRAGEKKHIEEMSNEVRNLRKLIEDPNNLIHHGNLTGEQQEKLRRALHAAQ